LIMISDKVRPHHLQRKAILCSATMKLRVARQSG
jgi:hypothetical protein